jgi:hypothetical protein
MAITIDGTAGITFPNSTTQSGGGLVVGSASPLVSGTAVASTSGTSITFTSIPSWVKRITVVYSQLSTNGGSSIQVQLGTSNGLTTSGYLGTSVYGGPAMGGSTFTTGLPLALTGSGDIRQGNVIISNVTGNTWISGHTNGQSNLAYGQFGGGSIALSGTLDRVSINMVNGTDSFDLGTINIQYE